MRAQMNQQLSLQWQTNNTVVEMDETALWKDINHLLQSFPNEDKELMPGLKWGFCYQLYTPAFWKLQYLLNGFSATDDTHRISANLIEEIVLCILGGYGIPAEMGLIAFERCKQENLIVRNMSLDAILNALNRPFEISHEKSVRYRFANQKARYIYEFLNRTDIDEIPQNNDLDLRNWLMTLNGIGPKTASWITRNWLRSERVAILDIHILRAGIITGFFNRNINIATQYYDLENKYLTFCEFLEVRPSDMDAIIWSYMKKNNKLALHILSSIT
ncbi:MAG TPA: hypothetical protein VHA52_06835 [Candidatus Babeliaceae bacterium]|nr:hypothetical protein [Candidatus Babeliaceae bacterium]